MIMPYTLGELFTQVMNSKANSSAIPDVQINGSSIINNGVANIPYAYTNVAGVVKVGNGLSMDNGAIFINKALDDQIKVGTNGTHPITPAKQHISTYYGLAKLAGVDLANEEVTVGTYPAAAKTAIKSMLDLPIPSAPIADGTYTLQVVVSSGTPTYSWVSVGE